MNWWKWKPRHEKRDREKREVETMRRREIEALERLASSVERTETLWRSDSRGAE